MAIEISARKREAQGTGASRRLRRLGKVPGILYGGDKGPVNIELDHQDLYLNLRNERFHASILTLDLGEAKEQVLLRSLNMHPFKPQVQHIDFQRVSKDKKIHMKLPPKERSPRPRAARSPPSPTRARKKRRSKAWPSVWLSAWAIQARSTSARATTPASGWSSGWRRRAARRCARTRSSRRWWAVM